MPFVLDGGLATELERRGLAAENDPLFGSSFLLNKPEEISAVHACFLESGADIVSTATYQATTKDFCQHLRIDVATAVSLIHKAVSLARQECDAFWSKHLKNQHSTLLMREKPRVAGSVGPYGVSLRDGSEYHGRYIETISKEELKDFHRPRIQNLVDAEVDFIAFETVPAKTEGEVLVELLREFPSTKAWLSFSAKDEERISYGDYFVDAIKSCVAMDSGKQLMAIGVNCTSPNLITPLLQRAKAGHTNIPFVVYPNSGENWTQDKKWSQPNQPTKIFTEVDDWVSLGAEFIGGCCRVSPSEISEIAEKINSLRTG